MFSFPEWLNFRTKPKIVFFMIILEKKINRWQILIFVSEVRKIGFKINSG